MVAKSRMPSAESAGPASLCGAQHGCGPHTISDPRGPHSSIPDLYLYLSLYLYLYPWGICWHGCAHRIAAPRGHGETNLVYSVDTCICTSNWVQSSTTWWKLHCIANIWINVAPVCLIRLPCNSWVCPMCWCWNPQISLKTCWPATKYERCENLLWQTLSLCFLLKHWVTLLWE